MGSAAVLAETYRGEIVEAVHRGHAVLLDRDGQVADTLGDPEAPSTMRSVVKPIQAVPFTTLALDRLGLGDAELAVACSSHQGEPVHLEAARRILAAAGVDESALGCGPQLPYGDEPARELIRRGEEPRPIHNNCSGKHAGMLAACTVAGWPLEGYVRYEHPLQQAVVAAWREQGGVDVATAPHAIDGCGVPTFGLPLQALAAAFLRGSQRSEPFRRCQAAMAAHPHLVGGTGTFDTALLTRAGDRLTAKSGGAAAWGAVARDGSWSVAIKLESGVATALPAVALAWLRRAGVLDPGDLEALDAFARPEVRNWAGTAVGKLVVTVQKP